MQSHQIRTWNLLQTSYKEHPTKGYKWLTATDISLIRKKDPHLPRVIQVQPSHWKSYTHAHLKIAYTRFDLPWMPGKCVFTQILVYTNLISECRTIEWNLVYKELQLTPAKDISFIRFKSLCYFMVVNKNNNKCPHLSSIYQASVEIGSNSSAKITLI